MTPAVTPEPNSAENPFPVRAVAIRVAGWIDKLGTVWVEGQLAQISMRQDSKTVFMVLRDPAAIAEWILVRAGNPLHQPSAGPPPRKRGGSH